MKKMYTEPEINAKTLTPDEQLSALTVSGGEQGTPGGNDWGRIFD